MTDEGPPADDATGDGTRKPRKGKLLGMPYNLTAPSSAEDALSGVWNKHDTRLFPPKRIGWGWTFNFYWLVHPAAWVRARRAGPAGR